MTTASSAIDTPELFSLVCSYADVPTCVTLLRVSKPHFSAAVSFVWKNLESPFHLLRLIPNIVVEGRAGDSIDGKFEITLPPYVGADFSRFDIYAPHVRSLQVRSAFHKLKTWDTLVSRSRLGPLLPHLSSLKLLQSPQYQTDPLTNELMWMTVFLNQTVTSMYFSQETGIWNSAVSAPGFRSLVDMISRTCPNLDSLSLPSINHNANEEHQLLHIIPNQLIGQSSFPLSGLRKLETAPWMFREEVIREVGSLAQLDHLVIRPEIEDLELPEHCPVNGTAFRALRKLTIRSLRWANVKALLSYQPLIRNLVSFHIVCPYEVAITPWQGAPALFSIRNMSELRNLDIELDRLTGDFHRLNPGDFFNVLSQLPLLAVRVAGVEFSDLSHLSLDRILPTVAELRLPHQKADLKVLSCFAVMPSLKHLAIAFLDWHGTTDLLSRTHSCCPSLETLELTIDPDEEDEDEEAVLPNIYPRSYIHTTATRILELFPNIKRITWPHVDKESFEHQQLCLLNTRIAVTREWNKARGRITERYGQDVANALLPDENFLARTLEPFV
ncbi:hypothetical protein FRC09_013769 [Ceratobasidium sp. 395]|nr:hypothetical protein FRC09_013769 [Ceratobasidium sp. 395]